MTRAGRTTVARAARMGVAVALTVPLTGGFLLLGATAAGAAVTSPGQDAVYVAETTVPVQASSSRGSSSLSLQGPGEAAVVVATSSAVLDSRLEYAFDTRCWRQSTAPCTGLAPARNGSWVATQSGDADNHSVRFTLRIPPRQPADVAAEVLEPRRVRVTWAAGSEPDLTGYLLQDGGSATQVQPGACDGGTCSATLTYPEDAAGEHRYTVKAVRSDGGSGTLESPESSPASATLPASGASPEPSTGGSPSPSTGGSPSPSTGGSPSPSTGAGASGGADTGGSAPGGGTGAAPSGEADSTGSDAARAARRESFDLSFGGSERGLGAPTPPSSGPATATAPQVALPKDGSYEPTLGFPDQVVRERVRSTLPAARVATAVSAVGAALDSERLVRSSAAALLLLLCAAHLRRWLAAGPAD